MTPLDLLNPFAVALIVGLCGGVMLAVELCAAVFPPEPAELLFCDCGRLVAVVGDD